MMAEGMKRTSGFGNLTWSSCPASLPFGGWFMKPIAEFGAVLVTPIENRNHALYIGRNHEYKHR